MLWIRPLLLTLQLMGLSVLVAAAIGIPLAFLISLVPQRRRWGRAVNAYCLVSLVACLATPMILHAAAWEATAGKFGWLTFSQTAARTYTGLAGRYSGLVACVWIHGLLGAAVVSLATWFATVRIAPEVIDQSRLDGGRTWTWWRIRLPIAAPWVGTALLATAILAATEMTVVDLYGVRTLADEFYLFHAVSPSITSILVLLVLPCALSIAIFSSFLVSRRRGSDVRSLRHQPSQSGDDGRRPLIPGLAAAAAIVMVTLMYAFPLAGLVVKVGHQITVSSDPESTLAVDWSLRHAIGLLAAAPREFSREYVGTATLAALTAAVCIPLAWSLASVTRRRPTLGRSVELLSLILFLIPGPIIGLTVVRLFTLPVPGLQTLYHQTLVPTVVALMARALPVSYWILRAGYAGIDRAILDSARIDFSWLGRLWLVDRPLLAKPLLIAGLAAAVVASGDVPATLPVIPPGVVTVGTRLFALLHSGARHQEAALAFWYVAAIIVLAIASRFRWKRAA
ncbi:hypothetical protein Mal15_13990 [Stieleria maiorica]|uniref:ABC transmembrane type-1 domain-containing protein n=1 Tax=Stieleria maiorica TaxID=2795974 RepID=A0A5B9M9Z8_9BACT|nr:amino acid ABC transporter permease [Stieleria maiorica]QEF97359.1 hypothetical protein Mal15_13990 [Stieleria maiorica]